MRSSTFDQIDQQILDLLIENSRISLIDISEQVGLSRVAVKNRIDALEKSGVIEHRHPESGEGVTERLRIL